MGAYHKGFGVRLRFEHVACGDQHEVVARSLEALTLIEALQGSELVVPCDEHGMLL